MNVRLATDDIRFRITAAELEALADGQELVEALRFEETVFRFSIAPSMADARTDFVAGPSHMRLSVSRDDLASLAATGPSKEGIAFRFGAVDVSLQVDVRSHRSRRQAPP